MVIIRVYFLHPVTFLFLAHRLTDFRVLWLKRRVSVTDTSFLGCEQKTPNALFPQCKTSIGNNSGSIKDRVVKFAYSMGFSEIADRMV